MLVRASGERFFYSNRSGNIEVWVADPDGSTAVELTSLGAASGFANTGTVKVRDSSSTVFPLVAFHEHHGSVHVVPSRVAVFVIWPFAMG